MLAQIQKILRKRRKFRRGIIARMLDDAFANFKCKIQPRKIEVPLLELFDDTQRMQIVIETAALFAHQFVKFAFAGVAEWRMTDVMDKSERFGKLRVQTQSKSGLRQKRIKAAIGWIRNHGVRKFLFDLLVDAGGLLRIGIAKDACKF